MSIKHKIINKFINDEFCHNIVIVLCRSTWLSPHGSMATWTMLCKNALSKGVVNDSLKNVGLRKCWQDREITIAFLISLEVSFLHGLFLLF